MSRFLVTGGAGFIGSNLTFELVDRGEEIKVLDNNSTGNKENIKGLITKKRIEYIKGDLRNEATVKKCCKNTDYIVHLAALPSVARSLKEPILVNEVNVLGTLNVLTAAKEENVKRVVFISSSSVYGRNKLPQNEKMDYDALSPYALTKVIGEQYCRFFNCNGVETIILRPFNVFGPRQNPSGEYAAVIPRFIQLMMKNKHPVIYGDGEQSRDFTYVDNVVEGIILATSCKKGAGEAFNVACGSQTSINELVNELNVILKKNIKPIYANERSNEIKHSLADITKAKDILNYKPKVSFKEGLKKTVGWFNGK